MSEEPKGRRGITSRMGRLTLLSVGPLGLAVAFGKITAGGHGMNQVEGSTNARQSRAETITFQNVAPAMNISLCFRLA